MFNIGSGEIAFIAVFALLVLGPKRLPELARGLGKFVREFRRQTDEVRGVVEREFYKLDEEGPTQEPPLTVRAAPDAVHSGEVPELPPAVPATPAVEPVAAPDAPVAVAPPADSSKPSA